MKKPHETLSVFLTICLLFLLALSSCDGAELDYKFIKAIHQVESSGRYGPILGDNGKSLGPLQIQRACFIDSGVKGDYTNCANYEFSVKVMTGYLNRYGLRFIRARDYQSLARIWNGGPNGYTSSKTIHYWERVKKVLDSK